MEFVGFLMQYQHDALHLYATMLKIKKVYLEPYYGDKYKKKKTMLWMLWLYTKNDQFYDFFKVNMSFKNCNTTFYLCCTLDVVFRPFP